MPQTVAFNREQERESFQERVSAWLDIPLSVLALVMLALIIIEFTVDLDGAASTWVTNAGLAIWAIFLAAFVFELSLAPSKTRFLRRNWLAAIAVVVPMFRVLRVFRALRLLRGARALRGLSLVRVSAALNRARGAIGDFVYVSRLGYVLVLTGIVTMTGTAAVYYFERGAEGANILTLDDALWWAATIITTVNSPLEPVTVEARAVAFVMRLFGLVVIGYLTARLAVYFIGQEASLQPDGSDARDELRRLREEIAELRRAIERRA